MLNSAVCLIAKNEERTIAQWIAFQRVIGFDEVVVYDNGSTDATPDIVFRISEQDAAVSYRAWPDAPDRVPQCDAYRDAVGKSRADWIAFFDTDEFLVL